MANEDKRIVIAGAGSIGCYAGGCLALAGRRVILLARPRIEEALRKDGLRATELARRMLAIDPEARSSMWDDLQRGRPTEIDELQGAILRLADREGTPAPLIKRVTALVRKAEQENHGSPGLTPEAVSAGLRSA